MTESLFDLSSRVAVVIGGTSGLGRAIAVGLARAGAHVVATSRQLESVLSVTAEIQALGRRSLAISSDVSNRQSIEALCQRTLDEFGRVDILLNCAGKTLKTATLTMSEQQFQDVLDTNLTGTLRSCQVFGKLMVAQQSGSIVNMASLASFVGFMEVAAYTASKSAIVGLTRALAVEWAAHGVRVNAIAPGIIPTPLNERLIAGTPRGTELLMRTPMNRFGRGDEIVGAAIYLASDASRFVTGEVMVVDGGLLASGVNQ